MMSKMMVASAAMVGAASAVDIRVLHINDFHSQVRGVNQYASPCGEGNSCDGGWARLFTAVKAAAAEVDGPVFFVDDGDSFMGSLFSTVHQGAEVAQFMNKLCSPDPEVGAGLTACVTTFGNHEFDYGYETLAYYVGNATATNFVSSNMNDACEGNTLGNLYSTSYVHDLGADGKVAFVGYTTTETVTISNVPDCITFEKESTAMSTMIAELQEDDVNIVIAVGHSGYDVDQVVAEAVPELDMIIGGHTHTYLYSGEEAITKSAGGSDTPRGDYPTLVQGVPIVQAFYNGRYLGQMDLTFDEAGDLVDSTPGLKVVGLVDGTNGLESLAAENMQFEEDEGVLAMVAALAVKVDEKGNEVIGTCPVTLPNDAVRNSEQVVANLVCDAMMYNMNSKPNFVAEYGAISVCLQNSGGVRASLSEGDVTVAQLISILPFGNTIAVVELTGAQLFLALEHGVSRFDVNGGGEFPQVGKGIEVVYDSNVAPGCGICPRDQECDIEPCIAGAETKRVQAITINGEEVSNDDSKTYFVVTNSFLANGGDSYAVLTEGNPVTENGDLQDEALRVFVEDGFPEFKFTTECRLVDLKNPGTCLDSAETEEPTEAEVEEEEEGGISDGGVLVLFGLVFVAATVFVLCAKSKPTDSSSSNDL